MNLRMTKVELLVEKNYITKDWAEVLETPLKYFYDVIVQAINLTGKRFFPEVTNIFRAFKECPYKDVKVVILGQDPYFDGSATGLAFDNKRNGRKLSKSLQMILKEMANDGFDSTPPDQNSVLEHLPSQGVLLLNTALTVEVNKAGSHTEFWKKFTEDVVDTLQDKNNIVWILWGNHAKAFKSRITNPTHEVVEGCHPAARGVHAKFLGGKYFSKTNALLENTGHKPINW